MNAAAAAAGAGGDDVCNGLSEWLVGCRTAGQLYTWPSSTDSSTTTWTSCDCSSTTAPTSTSKTRYAHADVRGVAKGGGVLGVLGRTLQSTHTQPFNGLFSGTTRWAGTRKVKPIWILLKRETVSGSGISWAIWARLFGKQAPEWGNIN